MKDGVASHKRDYYFKAMEDEVKRTDLLIADIEAKQLHLDMSLKPVEVVANERRIEQVVVNFLSNAIRYTPEQESILVTTSEDQDTVKICIENKGTRIPNEQLEKIWGRFFRGESSRQRSTGGTGLGLAISKKILEMHDVPYGVTNTPDGVMFYFH